MKSSELLAVLEQIAPLSLSDEFCRATGSYDNSGIMVDGKEEIEGVLFSLDLSQNSLNECVKRGFNAIVTHHPAIFGGVDSVICGDYTSGLIYECAKRGITVISMHLNYDAAPEGIDYGLMLGLGGDAADVMLKLSRGGYGRVFDVTPRTMRVYADFVKQSLGAQRIIFYGDENRLIRRVASFCGAGCDAKAMDFALLKGADVFVSSDIKHHQITALSARGLNVIIPTHYAAENYGFNLIYKKIIEELNVPAAYYCDLSLV